MVALKSLHSDQLNEFVAEAKMLRKLKHPNVVAFFGIYEEEEKRYMVTEFLSFGSVLHLLRKERDIGLINIIKMFVFLRIELILTGPKMPLLGCCKYCTVVSFIYRYIHDNNVIHRDLAGKRKIFLTILCSQKSAG